jgi:RNA polymerase sigma-70 factor (ECF subfamily)
MESGVGTSTHDPNDPNGRFRVLYAEHLTAILGYAVRRVPAPEDAADVVAETFLVAWRRLSEVPPDGEARLWLYGVARRVLANHLRGEVRRSRLGDRLRTELAHQVTVTDPADEVVQVGTIRTAMAALDRADCEVLELTAWEELAPREIAVTLGISPEAVRTRLSRARRRLRENLDAGPGHESAGAGHVQGVRPILVPKGDR